MTRFAKMLYLMGIFTDSASRAILFLEWFINDPILETRFQLETRLEVLPNYVTAE